MDKQATLFLGNCTRSRKQLGPTVALNGGWAGKARLCPVASAWLAKGLVYQSTNISSFANKSTWAYFSQLPRRLGLSCGRPLKSFFALHSRD